MDRGQRRRHSSALVVSFLSNHVPWLEVKTGGLSGPGRFIFRLRWPGSSATPRDGTRSAASPKKSKIRRKITIRKRIKSTIKIKSRTSWTRPTNAGRPARLRAPDPTPAPPLALSPLPDLISSSYSFSFVRAACQPANRRLPGHLGERKPSWTFASGRFPSGRSLFCGLLYVSSERRLAAPLDAGSPSRPWIGFVFAPPDSVDPDSTF